MANFFSYDSTVRYEDVLQLITNVSIQETPFMSSIGVGSATDTEHKWMIDEYEDSADNAQVEGEDPTYGTLADPTKTVNFTQIFSKPFQLTETKLSIKHHGAANSQYEYHKMKKIIALKKDMEHALLFGTNASGTGSAARRLKGLISFITSYKDSTSYSNKELSPSIMNAMAQAKWAQSSVLGGVLLVGAYQKRRISENFASFDSANRREVIRDGRTLSIPVDTIVTDFGTKEVVLSHEMNTNKPKAVVEYAPQFHKLAYLTGRAPKVKELAQTGDSRKFQVIGEGTLEVHNEKTNAIIDNLKSS